MQKKHKHKNKQNKNMQTQKTRKSNKGLIGTARTRTHEWHGLIKPNTVSILLFQTPAVSVEFCVQYHETLSPTSVSLPPSYHTVNPEHPAYVHTHCTEQNWELQVHIREESNYCLAILITDSSYVYTSTLICSLLSCSHTMPRTFVMCNHDIATVNVQIEEPR